MVLGKLPVPGRPTIWITIGQGPTALAVGAGEGCLEIFTLIYPFSPLSPSLWEMARYRLKYSLKGPLNPKQPTNQHLILPMPEAFQISLCTCSKALRVKASSAALFPSFCNLMAFQIALVNAPRRSNHLPPNYLYVTSTRN